MLLYKWMHQAEMVDSLHYLNFIVIEKIAMYYTIEVSWQEMENLPEILNI